MNIELILWIVAFFIVWEIIYIIKIRYFQNEYTDSYIYEKILSGFLTLSFFALQIMIGADSKYETLNFFPYHYERLLYEVGIILLIFLFFKLNKWVYNKINKK